MWYSFLQPSGLFYGLLTNCKIKVKDMCRCVIMIVNNEIDNLFSSTTSRLTPTARRGKILSPVPQQMITPFNPLLCVFFFKFYYGRPVPGCIYLFVIYFPRPSPPRHGSRASKRHALRRLDHNNTRNDNNYYDRLVTRVVVRTVWLAAGNEIRYDD